MNQGQEFAERWAEAWNSMDLEQALRLWADDMAFCSPLAAELTGSPMLHGKAAARAYRGEALRQAVRLRFEVLQVVWDAETRTVCIVYRRERGDDVRLAAEVVRLDDGGRGVHGIALHGAAL